MTASRETPPMTPKTLQYLLAVAEHGNFTRAAEALGMSQPGLSQQIRQIEEALGTVLFDRSARNVHLTDAGALYLEYARRASREMEAGLRAVQDVENLSTGTVRLAITPTFSQYLVGPLVARFLAMYPGIQMTITEMPLDDIDLALVDGEVDMGIGFADVQPREITSTPLFDEEITLMVSRSHPLARTRKPLEIEALGKLSLALLTPLFASRTFADAYFRTHGITPNISVEANSVGAVLSVVRSGAMATLLPRPMVQAHAELVGLELAVPVPARPVVLLEATNAYRRASTRAFAAHIVTFCTALHGSGPVED